jgi:probable HAF family extracellular repeat protein
MKTVNDELNETHETRERCPVLRRCPATRMTRAASAAAALALLTVAGLPHQNAAALSTTGSADQPGTARSELLRSSRSRTDNVGLRGHGFVRDAAGDFDSIDIPGATSFTMVFGVNTNGDMVGGYVDAKGATHGFLRHGPSTSTMSSGTKSSDDDVTTIDVPGAESTFAFRANDAGQIVGAYSNQPNVAALELPHGFLFDAASGAFTKIDVPGAIETRAFGINNAGQIVGEYVDAAGRSRGFLLDTGRYTTFDAPDGASIWATDIDDSGRIVGTWFSGAGIRGFVRDTQGVFTAVEAPAAPPPPGRPELPTTRVFGISNRGQVTGIVIDSEGIRAFLLDNGVFTTIEPPEAIGPTLAFDVADDGRVAGAFDMLPHGYLRNRRGNFTTIDHPDAAGETVLSGINRRGQIVGGFLDAEEAIQAFLFDQGGFIPVDVSSEVPEALASGAIKINDRGQMVGTYSTLTNKNHAFPTRGFLLDRGVITLVDVPGAQHTVPYDIDNRERIVGHYVDADGIGHGFLRDRHGNFTTIDPPGAILTEILGINDRGQMVGEYADASGMFHGFLWDDGTVTIIDAPGGTLATRLIGINNDGVIVGWAIDDTHARGFRLQNGSFTRLGAPGAFLQSLPFDIDERGRIVGISQ